MNIQISHEPQNLPNVSIPLLLVRRESQVGVTGSGRDNRWLVPSPHAVTLLVPGGSFQDDTSGTRCNHPGNHGSE